MTAGSWLLICISGGSPPPSSTTNLTHDKDVIMREMETKKRTANQLVHPAIGLIRGRSSTSRRQVLAANTNPTHSRNPCSRQILSTQPEHPRDALCSVLSDLR